MRRSSARFSLAAACVASGLIAAACATIAPDPASPVSELTGTQWVAQSINGNRVASPRAPQLAFGAQDRLTGSGGCNALFAVYEINEGAIDVRGLGSTERACDSSVMQQEAAFLTLLNDAARYRREGAQLVLTAEDGRNVVFAAAG